MTAADDPDDYLMHLIHSTSEDTLLALEDAGKAPEKLSIKDRKAAAMSAAIESFSYDVHVMLGIKVSRLQVCRGHRISYGDKQLASKAVT